MIKKLLLSIMIAMLGIFPCFASKSLVILLKDSTTIVCSLAKEPQMTFGEKTITLTCRESAEGTSTEGMVGQWDFADVDSWSFADIDAINDVKAEKALVRIEGDKLTIVGNNVKNAAIYDTSGRLIVNLQSSTFSMNRLNKGTYLLKVGNNSVKFMVK